MIKVDDTEYERHETVKLTSEAIKLGPIPIGQRKRGKIPSSVGDTVRVAYLPTDPSKAILTDNKGLMNVKDGVASPFLRPSQLLGLL